MSKKVPPYLRLHLGDVASEPSAASPEPSAVQLLCESFERLAGWSLSVSHGEPNDAAAVWSAAIPGNVQPSTQIVLHRAGSKKGAAASLETAREMASSIGRVLGELERTQTALWQREAELAAGVPVSPRADEESHLAERLQSVLQNGAELLGCEAAALYLLDEATSQLKLRASYGLPKERFLEAARPLRGAVADLEALVGHAVVLEDTEMLPHWRCPENYPAAACVPVSSPTMPLGTLWFFSSKKRDFDAEQTNLMETISGRLAADLEREILLREAVDAKQHSRQFDHAAQWQAARLPRFSPPLEDWKLAGWSKPARRAAREFYDWSVLPDGLLAACAGEGHGEMLPAALTAAALHSAIRAHGEYRHTARQMMERVNDTLWSSSAGGQTASLCYALIDPESGAVDYCATGRFAAIVLRSGSFEALPAGSGVLGAAAETEFTSLQLQLEKGDALILVSGGALLASRQNSASAQAIELARKLSRAEAGGIDIGSADELLDDAIELVSGEDDALLEIEQTILVMKRRR